MITITCNGKTGLVKAFTFSGGERHVSLKDLPFLDKYGCYEKTEGAINEIVVGDVTVLARIQSPEALIDLLLIQEVLQRTIPDNFLKTLVLPYFPYARQDRITEATAPFSLRVVNKLISELNFNEIVTYDLHSAVSKNYFSNLREVTQLDIIKQNMGLLEWINEEKPMFLAPDKGALPKTSALAAHLGAPLLHANKQRNPVTGVIEKIVIPAIDYVKDRTILIPDDICDGGATFIELGKQLKAAGAKTIAVAITHGLFSKGFASFKGIIDRFYSTNTAVPLHMPLPDEPPLFIWPIIKEPTCQ